MLRVSRLGTTDPEFVIGDDNKGSFPGFNRFRLKDRLDSPGECAQTWCPKSNQQKSMMHSRCKAADVGKV